VAPPPWNVWPYHRAGSALEFPRGEGWHRLWPARIANPWLNEMEWVYLNSHLEEQGGAGRLFVVFAAYFTQHVRFLVVRAFDGANQHLGAWTGAAWGLLRPSPKHLDLKFHHGGGVDEWHARRGPDDEPLPFQSRLRAIDDARRFSLELHIENQKRPYEAGGIGHLPFGKNGSFYYYSLTRLGIEGTLSLPSGPGGALEHVPVRGLGWYDHQWGPFYVSPFRVRGQQQYEWMSIQLDSGDEILLTTVWDPNGHTPSLPAYGGAGLIRSNQRFERLIGSHRWQRTHFWRDPKQGVAYASGWTFDAPEWKTSLVIVPRYPDQVTPILDAAPRNLLGMASRLFQRWANRLGDFWEGSCVVSGTFDGRSARGVAFAELIKRYEDPVVQVAVVENQPGLAVVQWRVTNPDEQVRLQSRFVLAQGGDKLIDRSGLDVPEMVLDDPALPRGVPLTARVVVSSLDGSLSGERATSLVLR
jgi:CrtC N-terminal lipocalin domain/Lipocalin-like domain